MKKTYLIFAIVCYILAIACAVMMVVGIFIHARIASIISIGLSMVASAVNGTVFIMASRWY